MIAAVVEAGREVGADLLRPRMAIGGGKGRSDAGSGSVTVVPLAPTT